MQIHRLKYPCDKMLVWQFCQAVATQ
jgi:hypothetical protein